MNMLYKIVTLAFCTFFAVFTSFLNYLFSFFLYKNESNLVVIDVSSFNNDLAQCEQHGDLLHSLVD